ncbi:MAG: PTS sugar transporter subunit IIA [Gammaproteobacteria bacterium]
MSVGVLIIAHERVGDAVLEAAAHTLDAEPLRTEVLCAEPNSDPDRLLAEAQRQVRRLDEGQGVLVLTDLCGSTPCNVATRLLQYGRIRIVTGFSLPMLIRVFNYPGLSLEELAEKAVSGGQEGVSMISGDP